MSLIQSPDKRQSPGDRLSPDEGYARLVRNGTWLAGLGGFAGAGGVLGYVLGGVPTDFYGWSLLAGGLVGAALSTGLLWRWLVPRHGGFSITRAPIAGILAAILAHAAVWFVLFLALFFVADAESLREILQAFGFAAVMAGFSIHLIGAVTLPLAATVMMTIAVWCRWRFGKLQTA